jgi:hypothetical protein
MWGKREGRGTGIEVKSKLNGMKKGRRMSRRRLGENRMRIKREEE